MAALESHAVSGTYDRPTSALLVPLSANTRVRPYGYSRQLPEFCSALLSHWHTFQRLSVPSTLAAGLNSGLRIVVAFLCVRKERASNSHLPSVAASNTPGQT